VRRSCKEMLAVKKRKKKRKKEKRKEKKTHTKVSSEG